MAKVVLLTGSNLGDRSVLLAEACERIALRIGTLERKSGIYESEPWGFTADGKPFLNQVLIAETTLSPLGVLDEVQAIEQELGRSRRPSGNPVVPRYESRPIDIDILFYDDLCLSSERLTIPHPLIVEREFVLVPLAEVSGNYVHPVWRRTIRELLMDLQCSAPKKSKKKPKLLAGIKFHLSLQRKTGLRPVQH